MTMIDLVSREDLKVFKQELLAEIREILKPAVSVKQWLRSDEVRKLLHISPGTLQKLRINGTLPYTRVGTIMYYKTTDIEKLLEGQDLQR